MARHDPGYKLLFSEPRMVEDLLRGFVGEKWVEQLDFSTLEKVNAHFVSEELLWRQDDVIWRVRFAGRGWLYVFLLLEFQSTPDYWMALRILVYTGLLWQDLVKQQQMKAGELLPPVFPVVLYNGDDPWEAPTEFERLVILVAGLSAYVPKHRYLLLEEQRIPAGELESLRNLVAALFRLEQSRTPEEVRRVVECLIEWLKEPAQASLRRAFLVWLVQVLLPARLGAGAKVPEVNELGEVRTMLAQRVITWTEEWKKEGLVEGQTRSILMLLGERDVAVPEAMREKIKACRDTDQLDLWFRRAVTARSVDELFTDS